MFDPFLTEKQILRKLGGDKISSKVFTYDGSEDAEFEEVGGELLVKLSDGVFDLNKVKKIKCVLRNNGQVLEYSRDELTLAGLGDGFTCLEATYISITLPAVFAATDGGLYGFASQQIGYVSYIEFDETIVPIDQKYLPGVCLPVVELTTTFSSGADLTEEEDKLLKAAWENDSPIVVKCVITLESNGGYDYCSAVWYKASVDFMSAFALSLGTKTLLIYSVDNGETWGCLVDKMG